MDSLLNHFDLIPMQRGNRMLRIGLGQHDGKWFFRIDLWLYGIRLK